MAEYSFPFPAVLDEFNKPDRIFTSAADRKRHAALVSNGIYTTPSDNLQVRAHSGLILVVKPGKAWVQGSFYYADEDVEVDLESADQTFPRIDSVVLRFDLPARSTYIALVKGVPAASPVAKDPIKRDDVYELVLAKIRVNAKTTTIAQASVTDTRSSSLCGYTGAVISKIDTDGVFIQFQDYLNTQINQWNTTIASQKSQWDGLYAELQELYANLSNQSFSLINNNFDDWSVKPGTKKTTSFLANNNIKEEIRFSLNNAMLANRLTEFWSNGNIRETVTFYASEIVVGSNNITTSNFSIARFTEFQQNGDIIETIS